MEVLWGSLPQGNPASDEMLSAPTGPFSPGIGAATSNAGSLPTACGLFSSTDHATSERQVCSTKCSGSPP